MNQTSTLDPTLIDTPTLPSSGTETRTGNLRVTGFDALPSPREIAAAQPLTADQLAVVRRGRAQIADVFAGRDDRLVVVVGPCSIHDPEAALDYADRLAALASRHDSDLVIVMRTYFEKPRTTIGWKGLINDPHLDGSHDLATGLRLARQVLREVTDRGLPCANEFLEPISPQYVADVVSWGAIGARTTESQIHRQMASGLSMPIGFKNGTDGSLQIAVDACGAAQAAQTFLGIDDDGRAAVVNTAGNPDVHVVLRGGRTPNYGPAEVAAATAHLSKAGVNPRVMIDASHDNSGKDHLRQAVVAHEIAEHIGAGLETSAAVAGVMLESFLVAGKQKLDVSQSRPLVRGQSVTDACMSWETTVEVLAQLAAGVRNRRTSNAVPSQHG